MAQLLRNELILTPEDILMLMRGNPIEVPGLSICVEETLRHNVVHSYIVPLLPDEPRRVYDKNCQACIRGDAGRI